jgi:uncharacterized membrane protein YdbT with pleckstrin-like domain
MVKTELVIPKTWRSELNGLLLFLFFCVLSVTLTQHFPGSIIVGPLFSIWSYNINLHLPLWWFLPFVVFVFTTVRIYNVRYIIDSRGVEARVGILSLNQRITRVRYEDIRSVETEQTLIGRALDIGLVEISTAATGSVEIILEGIASPKEVQDMLQRERETRQKTRSKHMSEDIFDEKAYA